jgi:hypothetical protein
MPPVVFTPSLHRRKRKLEALAASLTSSCDAERSRVVEYKSMMEGHLEGVAQGGKQALREIEKVRHVLGTIRTQAMPKLFTLHPE